MPFCMPDQDDDADPSSAYEDFKRVFSLFASAEELTGAAPAEDADEDGEPGQAPEAEPADKDGKVLLLCPLTPITLM